MKIEVRLFATLREGRGRVLNIELEEGSNVDKALELLIIERYNVALLLINGRDGNFGTELHDGDVLSLFPPVGGG